MPARLAARTVRIGARARSRRTSRSVFTMQSLVTRTKNCIVTGRRDPRAAGVTAHLANTGPGRVSRDQDSSGRGLLASPRLGAGDQAARLVDHVTNRSGRLDKIDGHSEGGNVGSEGQHQNRQLEHSGPIAYDEFD